MLKWRPLLLGADVVQLHQVMLYKQTVAISLAHLNPYPVSVIRDLAPEGYNLYLKVLRQPTK